MKTFRGYARKTVTGDGRKNPSTAMEDQILGKRKKVGKSKIRRKRR
ncbi:hypothetical protein J4480_00400 [Candidatus Woesearchaeota archaeon]|nr:hypothetical protein [Candidatus Woesearchaeota archaeon]